MSNSTENLKNIERRLYKLGSKNLSDMGYEAGILHRARLADLRVEMIRAAIGELVKPAAADEWMDIPNEVLNGRTPTEAAKTQPDLVRDVIRRLGAML